VRTRIAIFVAIVQSILFLAHAFLYKTWIAFWETPGGTSRLTGISILQVALALLSVSFVAASFLAFRYSHLLVRLFYTLSAVWLGILSFCFYAASLCWVLYGAARLFGLHVERRPLAVVLLGLAILAGVYGIINASWTRVNRITIRLPNLPESWRGRVAALVSDTHLGHVRNYRFGQRIVSMLARLRPDVVLIAGDLYDGTAADLDRLAEPWTKLSAPLGAFFVTGNHEEFFDRTKYLDAVDRSGVRILNNEKVVLDGLQLIGVHYRDSIDPQRLRSILQQAALDRDRASILLTHAPHRLPIPEEEGISLQLSGHTHGGQFIPYTWITSRIYGPYVYGLSHFGNLTVYTSSGAGTWGPPMRVGTKPEIVLIRFE
jgi:predicted MPP superfamily phosphohydrolase